MASPKIKIRRPSDEDESATPASPAPEVEEVQEAQPAKKERVSATASDNVRIVMLQTVDPAPRVGTWNGRDEIGSHIMKQNTEYVVPAEVAAFMQERGVCKVLSS